jgi:hypothetical protein
MSYITPVASHSVIIGNVIGSQVTRVPAWAAGTIVASLAVRTLNHYFQQYGMTVTKLLRILESTRMSFEISMLAKESILPEARFLQKISACLSSGNPATKQ